MFQWITPLLRLGSSIRLFTFFVEAPSCGFAAASSAVDHSAVTAGGVDHSAVTAGGVLVGAAVTLVLVLVTGRLVSPPPPPNDVTADLEAGRSGKRARKAARAAQLETARKQLKKDSQDSLNAHSAAPTAAPVEAASVPQLRARNKSIDYTDRYVRGREFSEMAGTMSEALRQNVVKVLAVIKECSCNNRARCDELILGLLKTEEIQPLIPVPREYSMLAEGVAKKWAELKVFAVSNSRIGRLACHTVSEAIAYGITEGDRLPRDGRIQRLCDLIGIDRSSLFRATQRAAQYGLFARLDPSRELRKDALKGDNLMHVLMAWEIFTRPEPTVGAVVRMRVGPNEYETHAVHWQEQSTVDIWMKMVELYGPLCQISQFYNERPRWVKKPKQESSLCPYCYGMKLLMIPYARLLEQVRSSENKCQCNFCKYHHSQAAENAPVPRHYKDLFKLLFCPKPDAPLESGFIGCYPSYRPCCVFKFLKPSDCKHFEKRLPGITECGNCGQYPLFGDSDCRFMQSTEPVWYQRKVSVPRTGDSGKEGKTREINEWTSLPRLMFAYEFFAQFQIQVNHRYRVDWQDEFARIIYSTPRPGRTTLAMDFGMSWEMCNAQEVKQEFFQHETVSIHSCASYSEWPSVMEVICGKHGVQRLDGLFGLSDDPKHCPVFVENHLDQMIKLFDIQRADDGRCEMDWLSIMTDGGPGHYKQRKNFYKTSKIPARFKRSDGSFLCVDWSFFAEHHGKCILDAFTAILKSAWNRHQLESKIENIDQHHILLQNAQACINWSKNEMFQQCKKQIGCEHIPSLPRKGCAFSLEQVHWQFVDEHVLDNARLPRNNPDATVVKGTLSHYHFKFIAEGRLKMRWLSCPCHSCLSKCWDNCSNQDWVGVFEDVEQQQIGNHGYGARQAERKRLIDGMASSIKIGDIVAVYTGVDPQCHKYWLAQVSEAPYIAQDGGECPVSGDDFEQGELVLKVTYYDRQGGRAGGDKLYRHCPGLGVFIISASLLRYHNITLSEIDGRNHARRHAIPNESKLYEMTSEIDEKIKNVIDLDFDDSP